MKAFNREHTAELEKSYRPCACRSTTPFFSDRNADDPSHVDDGKDKLFRTFFQHDRDKLIYSTCFRRLRLKTQIFPEHTADHLRTRLDHTLEVSQISRHIARQLSLNEDLVDAIALGHDVGHAPFAHSGERALHKFTKSMNLPNLDGFKHNWQSLRIIDKLARAYPDVHGLNMTRAVRIGVLRHSRLRYKAYPDESCSCDMHSELKDDFNPADSACNLFEVQLVEVADEFAQLVHDFEDAVRSDTFKLKDFVKNADQIPFMEMCVTELRKRSSKYTLDEESLYIAGLRSEMIYQLTLDLTHESLRRLSKFEKDFLPHKSTKAQIKSFDSFIEEKKEFTQCISLNDLTDSFKYFKTYLNDNIIKSERVNRMDGKADFIIHKILGIYLDHPKQASDQLLDQYKEAIGCEKSIRDFPDSEIGKLSDDPIFVRACVDYVAGMTDRFALREYDQLYAAYPRTAL